MARFINNRRFEKDYCKGRLLFTLIYSVFLSFLYIESAIAQTCISVTANTPAANFIDNGNGTATHTTTGLIWKRCSEGQVWNGTTCTGTAATYTWQGALQQASTVNIGGGFAGFTDWRVPNIKELFSIEEWQCTTPAINLAIFPSTVSAGYWSSSPFATNATAWRVNFNFGNNSVSNKSANNYVRLVRGGQ